MYSEKESNLVGSVKQPTISNAIDRLESTLLHIEDKLMYPEPTDECATTESSSKIYNCINRIDLANIRLEKIDKLLENI
jgi:hypothetical protein